MSKTKDLDLILRQVKEKYPTTNSQVAIQGLYIDIALAISKMRDIRGVSQKELATNLETAQSTVARWETPGYSSYTLRKLNEIAESLDYTLHLAFNEKKTTDTGIIAWDNWNANRFIPSKSVTSDIQYVPYLI